jgi:hypothetical protein
MPPALLGAVSQLKLDELSFTYPFQGLVQKT